MTMTRRLFIVFVLWGCCVSTVNAQTEKFANNPNGGAQATLVNTITSGQGTLVVSSATLFPSTGIFTILINVEYLLCTSVSGTTFTCSRGSESSTPAAHTAGANIYHVVTDRSLRNNPLALTTAGDLPYLNGSFAQARLGIGATNEILTVSGGLPTWQANSGTWTPTLTNAANLDGSTAFQCQYTRGATAVNWACRFSVNPTSNGASTQLGFTIPVTSNFGAVEDAAGTCVAPGIAGQGAGVSADATNDRMVMEFIAVDSTDQVMVCSGVYQVI